MLKNWRFWPVRFYRMDRLNYALGRVKFAVHDGSDGRKGLFVRLWRAGFRIGYAFDWKWSDGKPHGVINWSHR